MKNSFTLPIYFLQSLIDDITKSIALTDDQTNRKAKNTLIFSFIKLFLTIPKTLYIEKGVLYDKTRPCKNFVCTKHHIWTRRSQTV